MFISFLKKEEDDEASGSKFMGKGDIIFLILIAAIVGGLWFYNKTNKENTFNHYAKCEALFVAEDYVKAKECYEDAVELGYRVDSLDSVGYNRVMVIDSIIAEKK